MFYYNYVDLCNKANKSPSAVAEEMGLKRYVVTAWKNGRVPRQATAQKVASYFGVSVDDLISNKKIPATGNGNGVIGSDSDKDEAIKLYQDAPQWLKDQVLSLLKAEVSSRADSGKDPKVRLPYPAPHQKPCNLNGCGVFSLYFNDFQAIVFYQN